MTTVTESEVNQFRQLANRAEIVGVVVKWKYPFYTNLEDLVVPQNAALVGLFGSPLKGQIGQPFLRHFDLVIWYETSYKSFSSGVFDVDSLRITEVESAVADLVSVIDAPKLRLILGEELLISTVANLRQKFVIPGATPTQLLHIRDKATLKAHAVAHRVPTAPYYVLDVEAVVSDGDAIAAIETRVGADAYPLFAKPTRGAGARGAAELRDRAALAGWLRRVRTDEQLGGSYLLEPWIDGREFWALLYLSEDGARHFNYLGYIPRGTIAQSLDSGAALCFIGADAADADNVMPGVTAFAMRVCDAFQPPTPHVFMVQGFQLARSGQLILTELAYRLAGARGTGKSYYASGASLETALIELHLKPDFRARTDANYRKMFVADIWYPTVAGRLLDKLSLPMDKLSSAAKVRWFVDVGQQMSAATNLADMAVSIFLFNRDRAALEKDADFICSNYNIVVVG